MARHLLFTALFTFALVTAIPGPRVDAHQQAGESLPGVTVEVLGRVPGSEMGDELVLLRVTIEPGASIPVSDGPRAAVVLLEQGRAGVAVERAAGEVNLTLAG